VLDGGDERKLFGMIGLDHGDILFVLDAGWGRSLGLGITFGVAAPGEEDG
jgi:hypothetical protein